MKLKEHLHLIWRDNLIASMSHRRGLIPGGSNYASKNDRDDALTAKRPAKPKVTPEDSSSVPNKSTKRKSDEQETTEYLRRKHHFIKSTIRTDYQPDICKDYKETGFCGFGDSCKFLHDRSDYKQGWQIEQEFAKGEYKEEDDDKYLIENSDEEQEKDDESEIKCPICKETYKNPIITKCKHFFCADCADKECCDKCFTCEKPTSGIFKNASKLINKPKI